MFNKSEIPDRSNGPLLSPIGIVNLSDTHTALSSGSRFVESILTVLATCQRHRQNALVYLTACCRAFFKKALTTCLSPRLYDTVVA